jgi:AraC family transcriptional regulator
MAISFCKGGTEQWTGRCEKYSAFIAAVYHASRKTGEDLMKHRIVELPAFSVVGLEYRGDGQDGSIGQLWQRFLPREHEVAAQADDRSAYGICAQAAGGVFHYIAGLPVEPGTAIPEGMVKLEVPAQKYAVFTHIGPVEGIADSFQRIHTELLPQRGLEPRNAPSFERYTERFHGPDDATSETDLYIPVY